MSMTRQQADRLLARYVKLTLRAGMYVSLVLLLIGIALSFASGGEVGSALPPMEALESALAMEAQGWMSLGIICLILTPLAGVVVALAVFARSRETRMVGVALLVIGVVALAIMVKLIA